MCRCGDSEKAPFCDGSHVKCEFNGENQRTENHEVRIWEGRNISTTFNPNLCMHVYYCQPLKELREKELETGDEEFALEISKVVSKCPSGALSFQMNEGTDCGVGFDNSKIIDIVPGGEIRIACEVDSEELPRQENQVANRKTLCRCGLSQNKPYCDGAHRKKPNFR